MGGMNKVFTSPVLVPLRTILVYSFMHVDLFIDYEPCFLIKSSWTDGICLQKALKIGKPSEGVYAVAINLRVCDYYYK